MMATVGPVGAETQALNVETVVSTAIVIQMKRFIFNFQITLYCFQYCKSKIIAVNFADAFASHYCLAELQPAFANLQDTLGRMGNTYHLPHSNTRLQALAEQPKPSAEAGKHKSQQVVKHTQLQVGRNIQHKGHSKGLDSPSCRATLDPNQGHKVHKLRDAKLRRNHHLQTHSIPHYPLVHVQKKK
jgi:hypothetical protein